MEGFIVDNEDGTSYIDSNLDETLVEKSNQNYKSTLPGTDTRKRLTDLNVRTAKKKSPAQLVRCKKVLFPQDNRSQPMIKVKTSTSVVWRDVAKCLETRSKLYQNPEATRIIDTLVKSSRNLQLLNIFIRLAGHL